MLEMLKPYITADKQYARSSTRQYLTAIQYYLHSFSHLASYPGRYEYVSVPFNKAAYKKGQRLEHLSFVAMSLVKRAFLQHPDNLINFHTGTWNKETKTGLVTRISMNESLADWLTQKKLVFPLHPKGMRDGLSKNPKPSLVGISTLKDDGERVFTPIDRSLNVREQHIENLNHHLKKLQVDISYPSYKAYRGAWNYTEQRSQIQGMRGNQLYRSFSREDGVGGRLWGHWVQRCPKHIRPFITFDRQPIYEGDFSSMQLSLLYAVKGIPKPEGDLYDISSDVRRAWMKQILTKTVGSSSKPQALGALRNEMKHSDPSLMKEANTLYEEFWSYHSDVRDLLFNGGAWKRLQYLESEIALEVIGILLSKDIVTIPLHDGFIVKTKHKSDLDNAMTTAYQRVTACLRSHR